MSRTIIASIVLLFAAFSPAADEMTRIGINQIMVQAHLKPGNRATRNNLDNKLVDGKATDEEKKRLLELYQMLANSKPPAGDLDAWKKRTTEIVGATQAVIRGEDKAAERFVKARDCKACHALHRNPQ